MCLKTDDNQAKKQKQRWSQYRTEIQTIDGKWRLYVSNFPIYGNWIFVCGISQMDNGNFVCVHADTRRTFFKPPKLDDLCDSAKLKI